MPIYNGKVIGGSLRLRSHPNTTGTVLTSIPDGIELAVSTISDNQQWFSTVYNGLNGYIMARWIAITKNTLPFATVTTASGSLNIRSHPSLSATVSFTAARNSVVYVLDFTSVSGWYWISCPKGTGWAVSTFLTLQEEPPISTATARYGRVVASPDVNIRNGIGSGGLTIGRWPYNRIGIIRDVDTSASRYQTTYNGQTAFVSKAPNHISNDLGDAPASILERMLYILPHELGQTNPEYYYTFQGAEWCQLFCRWLLLHAGMPLSAIPNESNTLEAVAWYCQNGEFWFTNQEHKTRCRNNHARIRERTSPELTDKEIAYLPRVGDFIYYRWASAPDRISVSHVGFVYQANHQKGTITTIEGNMNDSVGSRENFLYHDNPVVVGFARPKYPEEQET